MTEQEWREYALCAQTDPEVFFPEKGQTPHAAVRVCAACPVRTECFEYAVGEVELMGVWGGTTARDRIRLRNGEDVRDRCAPKPTRVRSPAAKAALERANEARQAARTQQAHERTQDALRLTEKGLSPAQVAELIGVDVRTVWRYLAASRDAA